MYNLVNGEKKYYSQPNNVKLGIASLRPTKKNSFYDSKHRWKAS